jgi:hypothetical protein
LFVGRFSTAIELLMPASASENAFARELLAWYRELIALRRRWPELTDPRLDRVHVDFDEDGRWLVVTRGRLRIAANLSPSDAALPLGQFAEEAGQHLVAVGRPGGGTHASASGDFSGSRTARRRRMARR